MDLNRILSSGDEPDLDLPEDGDQAEESDDTLPEIEAGYCVECGDQKADLHCAACEEDFCEVCSSVIHRVRHASLEPLFLFWPDVDRLGGGGTMRAVHYRESMTTLTATDGTSRCRSSRKAGRRQVG